MTRGFSQFSQLLVVSSPWLVVIGSITHLVIRVNRNAVTSRSPGLPLRLPWVKATGPINRNAVAAGDATRSGLIILRGDDPGLRQPWALGQNRFAVNAFGAVTNCCQFVTRLLISTRLLWRWRGHASTAEITEVPCLQDQCCCNWRRGF